MATTTSSSTTTSEPSAPAIEQKKRPIICWFCNKQGHKERDCLEQKALVEKLSNDYLVKMHKKEKKNKKNKKSKKNKKEKKAKGE